MAKVFISHSWHDKRLARKLAKILQSVGVTVWVDEAEIKLGDSLIKKIIEGINEGDYVIALLSEESSSSNWVRKELEVAMNQEIEGKRVKVLPILAQPCSLPSFLTDKLYADMSNPRAFRKELPKLLDRLNIDPALVLNPRSRNSLGKASENRKRATKILKNLTSSDPVAQYRALEEVRRFKYDDANLFYYPNLADAIATLMSAGNSTHIRLQALKVLGDAGDRNFASIITPFLEEENNLIVNTSVSSLAELNSDEAASQILEILRKTKDASTRLACLDYFAKVHLLDEDIMLAIIKVCEDLQPHGVEDLSVELKIIKALGRQWDGYRDKALEALLNHWTSDTLQVRLAVLEVIAVSRSLYIGSPRLRERFYVTLERAFFTGTDEERVKAWMVGFFSKEVKREEVWRAILSADQFAVEILLNQLVYVSYLDGVLNSTQDITALEQLLESFQGVLREDVFRVLARLNSKQCLRILAARKYEPNGWAAVDVLRTIATLKEWDVFLGELLELAVINTPEYAHDIGEAFSLLAQVRARRIGLEELISNFPKQLVAYHDRLEEDKRTIRQLLEEFKGGADAKQSRRLSRLIQIL